MTQRTFIHKNCHFRCKNFLSYTIQSVSLCLSLISVWQILQILPCELSVRRSTHQWFTNTLATKSPLYRAMYVTDVFMAGVHDVCGCPCSARTCTYKTRPMYGPCARPPFGSLHGCVRVIYTALFTSECSL